MFGKLVDPSARLQAVIEQPVVFVYPALTRSASTGPPMHESTLRGHVKLQLSSRQKDVSLSVILLRAVANNQAEGQYDETITC